MQKILYIVAILNISTCLNMDNFSQLQELGDKKQCLPLFAFTAFNGYKLYQFIQNKQNDNAFFQALDVIKCLYLDYKCLKNNELEEENFLEQIENLKKNTTNFNQDKQECIDQNMQKVVDDIQSAVEDLIQRDFRGILDHLMDALRYFKQAQEC